MLVQMKCVLIQRKSTIIYSHNKQMQTDAAKAAPLTWVLCCI